MADNEDEGSKLDKKPSSPEDYESPSDDYVDADFAQLQKTLSHQRRASRMTTMDCRVQNVFPVKFSPHFRPLTSFDVESCVALENAAFLDPKHRSHPEKFRYRLTKCPELTLGIFCTVVPSQIKDWEIETLASARPVETHRPDGAVSLLVGHIVSTMCHGEVITDADMAYPEDWASRCGEPAGVGHQPDGRTVALHSLAVSPRLQGCGLGQMLVKAYLQQIKSSELADRVVLICQDYLVDYYKRFGFEHKGPSHAAFGGGGWHNMVFKLAGPP